MFATPKLLESLCLALEDRGQTLADTGIRGIFSGGTEFTPQWTRFAVEELLDGVYMTPTYGNTLMGLAASRPVTAEEGYTIAYYAPQPRAVLEVVDPDDPDQVVDYGATGRVRLTTLTREFFVPGFLERDEGEREQPYVDYPWDGVSGVRPFAKLASGRRLGSTRGAEAPGYFIERGCSCLTTTKPRRTHAVAPPAERRLEYPCSLVWNKLLGTRASCRIRTPRRSLRGSAAEHRCEYSYSREHYTPKTSACYSGCRC